MELTLKFGECLDLVRIGEEVLVYFCWDEKLGHKLKAMVVVEIREPEAILINIYLWLMPVTILSVYLL